MDGDRIADFAIGVPAADCGAGKILVVSGATYQRIRWITDRDDDPISSLGGSMETGGDVDGDGVQDILVGRSQFGRPHSRRRGVLKVFSGRTGQCVRTNRPDADERYFGAPIVIIGDIDGDGHAEYAAGYSPSDDAASGVRVFSGKTGDIWKDVPLEWGHIERARQFCAIGDLDGDGFSDLAIGVQKIGHGRSPPKGDGYWQSVQVLSVATGTSIGRVFAPNEDQGAFGTDIASVGDIDEDGVLDLVVSSLWVPNQKADSPDLAVFSTATGQALARCMLPSTSRPNSLETFRLLPCPDIDGDGRDDIVVSDPEFAPGVTSGRVWVCSSTDGRIVHSLRPEWTAAAFGRSMCVARDERKPLLLVSSQKGLLFPPEESIDDRSSVAVYSLADGALIRRLYSADFE